jgi:hypothetical protein
MKAEKAGADHYVVTAEPADVSKFMASWPASQLDDDASYSFTFSSKTGDLVDIVVISATGDHDASEDTDGPDLAALAEDAMAFGAIDLSLEDVIAIRGIELPTQAPKM